MFDIYSKVGRCNECMTSAVAWLFITSMLYLLSVFSENRIVSYLIIPLLAFFLIVTTLHIICYFFKPNKICGVSK